MKRKSKLLSNVCCIILGIVLTLSVALSIVIIPSKSQTNLANRLVNKSTIYQDTKIQLKKEQDENLDLNKQLLQDNIEIKNLQKEVQDLKDENEMLNNLNFEISKESGTVHFKTIDSLGNEHFYLNVTTEFNNKITSKYIETLSGQSLLDFKSGYLTNDPFEDCELLVSFDYEDEKVISFASSQVYYETDKEYMLNSMNYVDENDEVFDFSSIDTESQYTLNLINANYDLNNKIVSNINFTFKITKI